MAEIWHFLTKNLLINLLFLIIMCFIANIAIGYFEEKPKLKSWTHGLIGAAAIFISILFGNQLHNGITFDLRQIPFIFVSLMEGPLISGALLGVSLSVLLMMDIQGLWASFIIFGFITLFSFKLAPIYLNSRFFQKLFIGLSLSIFSSLVHLIFIQTFDHSLRNTTELWTVFLVIPSFGIFLILSISEGIKKYFLLKKEVFKAEKLQVVSHLAASFGHEVRNPIAVSRGFLQLLMEEEVSSEKRIEYARIAIEELDHAEKVIHNYLTFAKPQIEKREFLDFRDEINKAVEIVLPMAHMNNIIIHVEYEPQMPNKWVLLGERNHLHQCLLNILKNAIEAMPKGGILNLEGFASEESIGIRISDSGIGMTKEQMKRLGEPYFSTKEKGTGLGMMVVFSIMKALHGKIEVESKIGKGTTFVLSFPSASRPNQKVI